jgi:lipopolysaccharide/colanic/teichoic acid biosynthesis glycosyltransferase
MIRLLDLLFSFLGIVVLSPLILILLLVGTLDTGSPIFRQERLGRNRRPFFLLKFRSMRRSTPSVATHLVQADAITTWGSFLRKTKLDELPQLFNVLMGDMSLVGPRPNLPNQEKLIHERERRGVYRVRPGITGLAQIQKIDMSDPERLAETDARMIQQLNVIRYGYYILMTLTGQGFGDRVRKT